MKSTDSIELKKAESRFTRAKNAVDGSEIKEWQYQNAKRSLARLRITQRHEKSLHGSVSDAVATPTSLKAQAARPVAQDYPGKG